VEDVLRGRVLARLRRRRRRELFERGI
jgi:hypothetical protein